jgi:DNA invertase Pin-like site-specific DNA recombinase
MKKLRIAIYSRVSTRDKQDATNQLAQLREYCERQGWEVVAEYIDHESGGTSKRTHFQRMFQDASQRKFDLVLFWALDRFTREGTLQTLKHLELLNSYGVNWKSFTESYLDSCGIFKDAVLAILATIARQEKIRIQERVRAGLDRARRQGRVGGRPKVVVDRDMVRSLHEAGRTLRQISDELHISPASAMRILKAS